MHITGVAGGPDTAAHLLTFDSAHGRRNCNVTASNGHLNIDRHGCGVFGGAQAWYENEIGYVKRMIELAHKVGASL